MRAKMFPSFKVNFLLFLCQALPNELTKRDDKLSNKDSTSLVPNRSSRNVLRCPGQTFVPFVPFTLCSLWTEFFEDEVELIQNVGLRQVVVFYRTHLAQVIDIADLGGSKENVERARHWDGFDVWIGSHELLPLWVVSRKMAVIFFW